MADRNGTDIGRYLNEGALSLLTGFSTEKSFWIKLLNVLDEALFIVNAERRIVFFNRKAEQITGYSQEEVLGHPCVQAVHCANCLCECILFEDGTIEDSDLEFTTKDGRTINVVKNSTTFADEAGNIIGGIEVFRDVTEERRLQAELAREKENLETVLDSIRDGVVALDSDGIITFVNRRVKSITGYEPSDLVGRSLRELHGPLKGRIFGSLESFNHTTATMRSADGSGRRVEFRVVPMRSVEQETIGNLVIFREITPSERVSTELEAQSSYHGMISSDPAMVEIFNLVETVSDSDVTVLIQGESGTGKEMLAHAIHATSRRKNKPFHVVNCAVFNENLLESELFGHCKGAFTGAVADKVGRFEQADGGTLFLDEIGELPPSLQVKLLRFLQDQTFERVGEVQTHRVDVRIIAATNRDLGRAIEAGRFRDDLYYRLNVIPVEMPPLRKRPGDIPLLVEHFIKKLARERAVEPPNCSPEVTTALGNHSWPGNIRELQNVVTHAVTCSGGRTITSSHLPGALRALPPRPTSDERTAAEAEREAILEALRSRAFNRTRAAEKLGITRTTLWRKMQRYRL